MSYYLDAVESIVSFAAFEFPMLAIAIDLHEGGAKIDGVGEIAPVGEIGTQLRNKSVNANRSSPLIPVAQIFTKRISNFDYVIKVEFF